MSVTHSISGHVPSFKPLYEQIKTLLTQSLVVGEWRPGELIPSEFDLAERYQVSQGTVRKAVDSLADENILIRRQGKGTFVASHEVEVIKRRFLRLTSVDGKKELLQSELISCTKSKADAKVADLLSVKVNTGVIEIKRLLTFSGRPLIYDHIVVPAKSFKGLNGTRVIERNGSMYSMYESQFGVRMIRAEERLKAVAASKDVAVVLGLKVGFPLLSIERVSFTYGDKPMEWRLGLCITDDHHYLSELE
jgi:GntR family transcriptional regulator